MVKEDVVPIHNGIWLGRKKNERLPFAATWRELIKWNKSDRERKILYDITYMRSLKNDTDEFIYKSETNSQTENKFMVAKEEGRREINYEFGTSRYTLLYIK